jgi:hypothetical protein
MAEVFSPASASSFVSRTLHCPNEHAFVDFLEQYLLAGPVGRDALFVALIKHVTTTGYDPARGAPSPARSAPAKALPAGHVGLAEMAATGISDAAAVHHAHDPARHGIERVALNAEASTGGMLDDLPPVGEAFVQVIAAENGTILLGGGALLPDSHVQYSGITRMGPASARAVAFSLLRAAETVGRA